MVSDHVRGLTLRERVYAQLEPSVRTSSGFSATNWILVAAILISTVSAIVETEPKIASGNEGVFRLIEVAFGFVFLLEYILRVWAVVEAKSSKSALYARTHFVFSLSGLIDLAVVVATFLPFVTGNILALRLIRLVRTIRLAKLGRMSVAMRRLYRAAHSRRYELGLTIGLAVALLIFGASALYFVEGRLQPEKFGSIPRALWWAVITLTTIGYGDVYPITPVGKVIAAFVAFSGIGLIAMPTGILAAAFSDAIQRGDQQE